MTSDLGTVVIASVSALAGVSLGALLNRRNEKQAEADRLLVSALNDVVAAIAEVTQTNSSEAKARYASAMARIALYASPVLVTAFRVFQNDANTITADGRSRLANAVLAARQELGLESVNTNDVYPLLFGAGDIHRAHH